MQKEDGVWTVTPTGIEALEKYADPETFWKQAKALYAQWKKDATVDLEDGQDSEEEVDEAVSVEDAEDAARSEILDYLAKMPPFDFQVACAKLVGALGHRVGGSPRQGLTAGWISSPMPTRSVRRGAA